MGRQSGYEEQTRTGFSMIEHPRAIRLWVTDLELARNWYSQALELEPVHADATSVTYSVGFCTLSLKLGAVSENTGASVYWGVEDVQAQARRIAAIAQTGKPSDAGARLSPGTAELLDPFGNVFGLTTNVTYADQMAHLQREAQKAALHKVRLTVDHFRQQEDKEDKVSRRVFGWAAMALVALIVITWGTAYFRAPAKGSDVRSTFSVPAK